MRFYEKCGVMHAPYMKNSTHMYEKPYDSTYIKYECINTKVYLNLLNHSTAPMLENILLTCIVSVLLLFSLHTNTAYKLWDKYYIDSVCPLNMHEKPS